MANASKRYPFVVEVYFPEYDAWTSMGAYRDRDEAEANKELIQKRVPESKLRVRNFNETLTTKN